MRRSVQTGRHVDRQCDDEHIADMESDGLALVCVVHRNLRHAGCPT